MAQGELAERWRFPLWRRRAAPRPGEDEAPLDPETTTDERLMARVGHDDTAALGGLFDRYRPPLFLFLLRVVGDRAAAEDLVQETFWRVWQHRVRYDPERRFSTWLYTIARHLAWNQMQSAGHQTKRFSELSEAEQQRLEMSPDGPPSASPEALALAADHRSRVQEALYSLPADQRLCLVLREYEGRSHREIGEILGCSEGNARVLTHRARHALRPLLKSLLESEEEPCGDA
jgi:RNA polymerase sigma-70 factor (ECF subfamily)